METSLPTATPMPADPESELPAPALPEEEEPASRRKKLLLLLLLFLLLLLTLISVWYLLFRQPISIPSPIAPTPMPSYQGALYGLSKPQDVAVSADGTRIVVTQAGKSLDTVMLDRMGNRLGVLAPPAGQVAQPHQLFVATDPATGEFWATDRYNGVVAIYDGTGAFKRLFDPGSALRAWQPLGIGFDGAGNAYIADVGGGAAVIRVFGADGSPTRTFGETAGLDHPNGIAVAANGTVYVTDTGNGRLAVFDAAGNKVGAVDRGSAEGNLGLPVGVAIDGHGFVMVVDSSAARVQAYSQLESGSNSPAYVNAFGEKGSGDANLLFPNGLAADTQGRLYVADWGNDRLAIWSY